MKPKLLVGDAVTVMRRMPAESVDAIVTDPPYNLSFMSKPWDAFKGQEDAGFAYWLAGLIDGEGHFAIKAHTRGTHAPAFTLKLRADERGTLEMIKRKTGIGSLTNEPKEPHPMVKWTVQDKVGCQRLVDLLDKYPLRAKKAADFWTWRDAVCEWTDRPRGNRWTGPADNSRMAELRTRLMEGRAYSDIPWSGNEFQDWSRQWATEALRVLKPGGHLLAFGGTRTWHRLAVAVEDAGFEIRDTIAWLYGSGFPKGRNLKPAFGSRNPGHHSTDFGGGNRPASMYDDQGGASRSADDKSWSTSTSGNNTTGDPFLTDTTSITETTSSSTTGSKTSNSSPSLSTSESTPDASFGATSGGSRAESVDPFAGSGTTIEAAMLEGFRCIAIEREREYIPLIMARIARVAA